MIALYIYTYVSSLGDKHPLVDEDDIDEEIKTN